MKKMRFKIVVLCFLFLFLSGVTGMAADWPDSRPIKIIYPYAPGGGADVLFRLLQPSLEKELGQKLVYEHMPGGSTKIGTMQVIKANPDGYTFLFIPGENWVPRYYSGVFEVKPWEQLIAIARIVSEPFTVLEVLAAGPYKTWADLVRVGEKKGKIICGTAAAGGLPTALMKLISKATRLNVVDMPFASSGEAQSAFLGGHVDMRTAQPSEMIQMVRAGETRALAISTERRMPYFPDTPTFKELGIGAVANMCRGFWGPLNLPSNIVNKFTMAVERAVKDPKFIKPAEEMLFEVGYRNPEQFKADVRRFDDDWGELLRESFKKQ
jgi:tripartite-type tricarboxylate transporter receptor subunit TctC